MGLLPETVNKFSSLIISKLYEKETQTNCLKSENEEEKG